MIYGCIGETLKHSFSKEIHTALNGLPYELCEVSRDSLDEFMTKRDFKAINVTIPYKEKVIPHLHSIDAHAREIGAVNTVVNRDGKLYGYNTDFFGLTELISHAGISVGGKKVVILGTGGTSKTASAVVKALGARETVKISRRGGEGLYDYEELYELHTDAEIIINTTPVGMYPNSEDSPCDLSKFDRLCGVIDAVYNPLRTKLVSEAKARGVPAECGLYMLVAQGVRASEIFLDREYQKTEIDRIYKSILKQKENIVLTGMPSCGKSTVGKALAELSGKEFVDTDELVTANEKKSIPDIFAENGESYFRDCESRAVREASEKNGKIIATGGGAILRDENVMALKSNGVVFFMDRDIKHLLPTKDRPLSSTAEDVKKRYDERYPLYCESCNVKIDANGTVDEVAEKIYEAFLNENLRN